MTVNRKGLRLAVYAAVTLIALCRTIWRIMSEGIRPFDWWMLGIEAAVLLFVGYEVGVTIVEQLHKRRIAKKVKALTDLLESGRYIQSSVPYQHREGSSDLLEWAETAKTWWTNTEVAIAVLSPRAATAFTHLLNFESADRCALDNSGRPYRLHGYEGDIYQSLQLRLANLQRIIEKPEVYL